PANRRSLRCRDLHIAASADLRDRRAHRSDNLVVSEVEGSNPSEIASELNRVSALCPGHVVEELICCALDGLLASPLGVNVERLINEEWRIVRAGGVNGNIESGYSGRRDGAECAVVHDVTVAELIHQGR